MNSDSLSYVEQLLADYLRDPGSVSEEWRRWFEANGTVVSGNGGWAPASAAPRLPRGVIGLAADATARLLAEVQDRVDQLVRGYRVRGHLAAQIDPLGLPRPGNFELELSTYGLTAEDLDREVSATTVHGDDVRTLRRIVQRLQETYCRSIGVQFMHIDDREVRYWLQERMESSRNHISLSRQQQARILKRLTDAEVFEAFLRRKFVGAKTFSLEGAETLIPLLDMAFDRAGEDGVEEVVIGMAHRGRLNVLANILGKREMNIFLEFDDAAIADRRIVDDVRYHLGYSSTWKTSTGKRLHLSLCFNPSHLEYVNPVALGRMRAKQTRFGDGGHTRGLTVLIHGDAAFAGEGIVQETLNLSELKGYRTGGTLHVIVNNQIGFTTEPNQSRSSTYATDVAKMLQIPIFHVNGEDPEAVAQVVDVAMEFRKRFRRDVVVDMYAFRRLGHNEGDEPRFTQPQMYAAIDERKPVREYYIERLVAMGGLSRKEAEEIAEERRDKLESEFAATKTEEFVSDYRLMEDVWHGYVGGPEPEADEPDTAVPAEQLAELLRKLGSVPENFTPHPKLVRFLEARREMGAGERALDFASAEALALGTLSLQGHPIRLTGQDSERGTFSHRHAVLHDIVTGATWMPLAHLGEDQARMEILNSPLSEAGVLGFEYGFSLDYPEALVAWEAQFGDFWNTAQVIVDQFIASAEEKWSRLSGLTCLLPHGYEGQGPEHSSARIERLLQLSTGKNIQVAYPSTPAQYFHLLRRQALRRWRKPLFVLTPKSLLRHPSVVSPLQDLTSDRFRRVLDDDRPQGAATRRVLLCTGKIYWELRDKRAEIGADDVAIVRVEQLAPFPYAGLERALADYDAGTEVMWVQEEPYNQGAWYHIGRHVGLKLFDRFPFRELTRSVSASPATGSLATHKKEQAELLANAFAG